MLCPHPLRKEPQALVHLSWVAEHIAVSKSQLCCIAQCCVPVTAVWLNTVLCQITTVLHKHSAASRSQLCCINTALCPSHSYVAEHIAVFKSQLCCIAQCCIPVTHVWLNTMLHPSRSCMLDHKAASKSQLCRITQVHVGWLEGGTAMLAFRGASTGQDGLQDVKIVRDVIDHLQEMFPGTQAHSGAHSIGVCMCMYVYSYIYVCMQFPGFVDVLLSMTEAGRLESLGCCIELTLTNQRLSGHSRRQTGVFKRRTWVDALQCSVSTAERCYVWWSEAERFCCIHCLVCGILADADICMMPHTSWEHVDY